MWDKLKGLVEKSPVQEKSSKPSANRIDWRTTELRSYLSHSGRVPFDIINQAARELNEATFSDFFTCPVLAGSAVLPGTMTSTVAALSGPRRRKSTLLFRPEEILNPSSDSEPLQKALYPLVKESTNSDPEMNLFTVGRSAGNNLVVADFAVSEQHATIELRKGYYLLSDMGSANGTQVRGTLITQPYELKDGDTITLGRLDFHFLTPKSLYHLLRDQ